MTRFGVEVVYVDGRRERHELAGERVTIGSSSDADVSIAGVPELAPLHVLLVPRDDGCWVSAARAAATPVTRGGERIENGDVPWGTELDLGSLTLRITEPADVIEARRHSRRSWLRLATIAALIAGAWWLLSADKVEPPKAPAEAPPLLDPGPSRCQTSATLARQRAFDLDHAAFSCLQRYPFDPQDGIRAAHLFGEARACLELAGDGAQAEAVAKRRDDALRRLEDDYRALRLRLERALATRDHGAARSALVRLIALLRHRPGAYLDWLFKVLRFVSVELEEA